jgi:Uma2 family endonuclease
MSTLKNIDRQIADRMRTARTHLMTAEELFHLPDDGFRHELIKGELLTMSPSGREHGIIIGRLSRKLGNYVETQQLGEILGAESGFKLETNPDTVLAPDIAFLSNERLRLATKAFHPGAPDLVVEVLSPNDRKREVEQKTAMWLALGTSAVWLVDPKEKTIDVRLANGEKSTFTETAELVDEVVVRGFRIRVAEIFP